jgi:hypothetical protein
VPSHRARRQAFGWVRGLEAGLEAKCEALKKVDFIDLYRIAFVS